MFIEKNSKITGSINVKGNFTIEGEFSGQATVEGTVKLKAGGSLSGSISCTRAYLDGSVDGKVSASENVYIMKEAKIKGSIIAKEVIFEEHVESTHPDGEFEPVKDVNRRRQDKQRPEINLLPPLVTGDSSSTIVKQTKILNQEKK